MVERDELALGFGVGGLLDGVELGDHSATVLSKQELVVGCLPENLVYFEAAVEE